MAQIGEGRIAVCYLLFAIRYSLFARRAENRRAKERTSAFSCKMLGARFLHLQGDDMKTIPRVLFVVLLAAFCCMALLAQDAAAPAKPKAAKPAAQAQQMPMPKPSAEMTKLTKMLSGNWTVA